MYTESRQATTSQVAGREDETEFGVDMDALYIRLYAGSELMVALGWFGFLTLFKIPKASGLVNQEFRIGIPYLWMH
jgi:hypothetical protein